MPNHDFDPHKELAEVKSLRTVQRRKRFRKSKLDRYRAELVAMYRTGASSQDLATWLRMKHRMKVHRSSIARYLRTLPEVVAKMTKSSAENTEKEI